MRLMFPLRSQPSRLVAAALTLAAGLALAAPGHACDKDKAAHAATASTAGAASCPAMSKCPMAGASGATAVTADLKGSHAESGCCGMSSRASATAAKSSAACPMTAACPPGMCGAKSASTAASMHGACPHDAVTSGARKAATVTRTASTRARPAIKAKASRRLKPAAGATAVAVTPGTAGLVAVIDPVTGGVGPATAAQLAAFAAAPKSTGGASTAAVPVEPEVVRLADGTLMARVPDRLMNNAVAHRDANGKITFSCGNDGTTPAPAQAAPATWEVK